MPDNVLLTVAQMYAADTATIAGGIPQGDLMEAAGAAIAEVVTRRWQKRPVTILCGPGNNGGDGLVVARLLSQQDWPVRIISLSDTETFEPLMLDDNVLVIDALFGAGLTRPLEGLARQLIEAVNDRSLDCLAVDMPSGVQGDTGEIVGDIAARCVATVTFFRRKPGHLLLPGRDLAGQITVAQIGIADTVLAAIAPHTYANGPDLWLDRWPQPKSADHKYSHGHGVVVGGPEMTGAARLAATAARRLGAGLVTIAVPPESAAVYCAGDPGNLIRPVQDGPAFADLLADPRITAVLVGPGNGVSQRTRNMALAALASGKPVVLDADALTVFADDPTTLFEAITGPVILTPHDGEFSRLFDLVGDKLSRTRQAAKLSGAVVLLKGSDTTIATPTPTPKGRAAINQGAPPALATAGSGDVLAGFITGLLARGCDPFDSACAGAWLHGRAGAAFGPGLIAEDLAGAVPAVLKELGQ